MPTIHASAVLAGPRAILIRGPSGSGKSTLAYQVIEAARDGRLTFARLVADDRVHIEAVHGRLIVRPAPSLAGLLELRGVGIRRLPYEHHAVAGLVVDLGASDAERMLPHEAQWTIIDGIRLPRSPVAPGMNPLPLVLERLRDLQGDIPWMLDASVVEK